MLDQAAPLANGTHKNATLYSVSNGALVITTDTGSSLADVLTQLVA